MSDITRTNVLCEDETYQINLKALMHRCNQRKISEVAFNHIQQWLAAAAMRRYQRQEQARARIQVQSWAALSLQGLDRRAA